MTARPSYRALAGFLGEMQKAQSQVWATAYDAFGVFGAIFRELEWKTPIFP
jgi:hypothetical protein